MPSWPTRLFTSSSAAPIGPPTTLAHPYPEPATPIRPRSNSIPRKPSQHGRSVSHPFPSIFGSGKKKLARDEDEVFVDAKVETVGTPTLPVIDTMSHAHAVRAIGAPDSILSVSPGRSLYCVLQRADLNPPGIEDTKADMEPVNRILQHGKGSARRATPMFGGHSS